ncbi:MAG TPA: hypothetical protein VGO62_12555, partial [Myxococcota bacterium]
VAVDAKLERVHEGAVVHTAVAPVPLRPGSLKMRSTPWVNVKVQSTGQKFSTPTTVPVAAGPQRLLLSNPEQNLTDTLLVTIPEDKELRVDLTYEQKNGVWKLKQKAIH